MQSPIQHYRASSPVTVQRLRFKEKSQNEDAAEAELVYGAASNSYNGTVRQGDKDIPVTVWLQSNEGIFLQLCLVVEPSTGQKENITIALFHGSTCSTSTKKDRVRIKVSPILLHPCIPARYKQNLLKNGKIYLNLDQNLEFLNECFDQLLQQAVRRGLLVLNLFGSTPDSNAAKFSPSGFTQFCVRVMETPELLIELCRIVNMTESAFLCLDNSRRPTFKKLTQSIKPGEEAAVIEIIRRFLQTAIFSVETARDKHIRKFFELNENASNEPIDITRGPYKEGGSSVLYYGQGENGSSFTPHGFGTQIHEYGRVFDGKWAHGRQNGPGCIFHQSGNISFGMFEDGRLKNGTVSYPNGDVYQGELNEKLAKHGCGKLTQVDGCVYEGLWDCDLRDGEGVFSFYDGKNLHEFRGNSKRDMFHPENFEWAPLMINTLVESMKFGVEPNNFVRMMLIGRGGVGKSVLADALKSPRHKGGFISRVDNTIGSNLHSLQLHASDGSAIEVSVQDCAGQRVAYISHCVHLSNECLYVLVWSPFKENRGTNELSSVEDICAPLFEWFGILASHAPCSHIVLVGTHCDTPAGDDHPAWIRSSWRNFRRTYDQIAQEVSDRCLKEVQRLNGLEITGINIQLHEIACVDSVSGANVCDLRVKLGAVVGNMDFVKKLVPKRYKTIRQSFPALSSVSSPVLPVLSKAQVIKELRTIDVALAVMPEDDLWAGVMFWAGLGVVSERNEQLFHDSTQVLDLIRPLVHPLPTALLGSEPLKLLLDSSKALGPKRDEAVRLLTDLENKLELSVELLDHFAAWSRMSTAQREAMLSFLLDNSLLCPLRDHTHKFRVSMRLSKDDAPCISPEFISKAAQAPHNAAYLFPIRFIALVPKIMSAIVSRQPERVKVNLEQFGDEGVVLTRGNSFLVLKVMNMAAACVHTTLNELPTIKLPDSGKFGCVVHVAGNDVGLLHIIALCIEDVFSCGKFACHRECWCLVRNTGTNRWIQFENQHAVSHSLVDAVHMDGCTFIDTASQLRFCDIFPQLRRRVFIIRSEGDGCGEFVHRLQTHIERLSFTSVGCSMCEAGSLDLIKAGIMESGVIVVCISPQFFLNMQCMQLLQWARELKKKQLRHLLILPLHPAVMRQHRQVIVSSNLLFEGGRAWHLQQNVLDLLSYLDEFDDPVPSYTELRPWTSDKLGREWKERTSPQSQTNPVSLLTSERFDEAGLVNRMIYSTSQFVDAVVRHSDCALSQPIFSSRHEPCAVNVGHSHVPDGYLDVTFYPEIAQYDELLHNMTTVPASERRRNLDQIHISVPAPANEPFTGIPIVSPAQVVPSGCNTLGKVQKGGEFYFKKLLDPFVKPCHSFIGMNCSKICCRDGCMRVHAVCNDPQNMFMLQPWMERTNRLDKVMSRQPPLPLPERIRIMRRIATAVCAYHDNGLTHCHVCPSKIFLDSQNAPHLMFPGSALLAAKLHYSSPDCVWGSVVSESSDVWSVGVIMYELLFNKPPFDSMSEGDIRDALAPAAPSWPPFDIVAPIPPGLPDDLPALLHRCWHRDASLRISITELARELAEMDPTPKLMQPLPLPLPSPGWQSQSMFDILRAAMPALKPDAEISAEVDLATHKCQSDDARLLMQQRSLTLLEGQSIYIFTTNLIYREFTEAYRSLQNVRIQLWNNYASALQSALNKLEPPQLTYPCPPGVPMFLVVFRGLNLPLTEISHEYREGSTVYFHCVQSTSTQTATMHTFGKPGTNHAAGTYMKLLVKTAKYIRPFSKFDGEEEYLTSSNTAFKVLYCSEMVARCMLRYALLQVLSALPYQRAVLYGDLGISLPPNHDFIILEEI